MTVCYRLVNCLPTECDSLLQVSEQSAFRVLTICYFVTGYGLFAYRVLTVWYNNNNTIIRFIKTRLQYNWHNNKNGDGLVNRLASNLVILNQARRVAWLIGQEFFLKIVITR